MPKKLTMIGAGLAGPLMASYLSERGYSVDIFERRLDMRCVNQSAGRSINLALSKRGIKALKEIGVYKLIKPMMLPMVGRMIHDNHGNTHLQKYGQKKSEVIYSISRAFLNKTIMDYAESKDDVKITFEHPLIGVDLNQNKLIFQDKIKKFERLFGSDGSSSKIRDSINKVQPIGYRNLPLDHGYKELTIPPDAEGNYRMDSKSLHIWPRGDFMLIALPNIDKSFTCTLFFPLNGKLSFSSINSGEKIIKFFSSYFPDTVELIPDLKEEYVNNPVGKLSTIYCNRWHFEDKALIFGDAAHAIVPFFGQGMNASFQDCSIINEFIIKYDGNWDKIFSRFSDVQVPNGHAIADMAIENYIEMRDSVNDPMFIKRRELEFELESRFTERFVPRYSMVSFTTIPYSEVYRRGLLQLGLIDNYIAGKISKSVLYEQIKNQLDPIR